MAGQKGGAPCSNQEASGVYKIGSILRIRMNNFLTYSDAEVHPGPNLNVVIGPNGSGKSTILCAVALGLGQNAKLLERGDGVGQFVMRDQERGWVEIELKGEDGKNHVIRRDLERTNNGSNWKLNGRKSTLKEITTLVTELGIQIDNLCTFLPQEKVGKFTELEPQPLLVETEEALSGTTLRDDHQRLIDLQNGAQTQDKRRDAMKSDLEKLEDQNKALEEDKRKMEERQQHLDEVELLNKVLLWVTFNEARERYTTVKGEKEQLERELQAAQQVLEPYREKVETLKAQVSGSDTSLKKVDSKHTKAKAGLAEAFKKVEDQDLELQTTFNKLKDIDLQRKAKEKSAADLERQIKTEINRRDTHNDEKCKEDIASKKAAQREVERARKALDDKKAEAERRREEVDGELRAVRHRLASLKDHGRQRMQMYINSNMPGAREACQIQKWIQENRDKFTGRVYGPVALEITIKDPSMAAAIENQIGGAALASFVVENSTDRSLLLTEWRDKRKMSPTVSVLGSNWKHQRGAYSDAELARLKAEDGIAGLMHDFIEGPAQVLAVLASQNRTTSVLIGNGHTEKRINEADLLGRLCGTATGGGGGGNEDEDEDYDDDGGKRNCNIYTIRPETRGQSATTSHVGQISRYSREMTSSSRPIRPARVLGQGVGGDIEEQIKEAENAHQRLDADLRSAENAVAGFEAKINEQAKIINNHIRDINSLTQLMKNRGGIATKIKRMEEKLAGLRRELAQDSEKKRDDLRKHGEKNTRAYMDSIVHSIGRISAIREVLTDKTGPRIGLDISRALCRHADREWKERREEYQDKERDLNHKARELEAAKKEARDAKQRAATTAPLDEGPNRDHAVVDKINELNEAENNNRAFLVEKINEEQAQADSIHDNPEVLRQYQRRKAEIEKKRAELEQLSAECDNRQSSINKLKGPWQEKLENVVHKLNARFSMYMRQMSCAGEVKLDINESDYSAWGIRIRVKFRDHNELQDLKARVQSGGERSVSTILYLMALQDLMGSPFRAVDEINQGMDERNERLIFSRIVANSRTTQYFLVTPKLLPRLTALEMPHVTVLFVFNASGLMGYDQWDIQKLIEAAYAKRARGAGGEGPSDRDDEEEAGAPSRGGAGKKAKMMIAG